MSTLLPVINPNVVELKQPSGLYIPSFANNSKDLDVAQRRVLLCGFPGDGKTFTSAMTSPNPTIVDIDKGITDPRIVDRAIPTIDIWDSKFTDKHFKTSIKSNAVKAFLKEHGMKYAKEQTLIIDSISSWQDSLLTFNWSDAMCPKFKGTQEKDPFSFYDIIKDYWTEVFTIMMGLNCHVIITAHLNEKYKMVDNKQILEGLVTNIEGSTKHTIGRFFTDVIRQKAVGKKGMGANAENITTEYLWQVKPDDMFKAKSRAPIETLHIPADFNKLLTLGCAPEIKK